MAASGPNVTMPTVISPIMDKEGRLTPDWSAFFKALQNLALAGSRYGTTANRPTSVMPTRYIGMPYYDTTLGQPIWLESVNPDVWVDATGTPV